MLYTSLIIPRKREIIKLSLNLIINTVGQCDTKLASIGKQGHFDN